MKESKPFLFKAEQKPAAKKGFFPIGAKETDGGSGGEGGRMTMKEAIAAKLGMGADEKGEKKIIGDYTLKKQKRM